MRPIVTDVRSPVSLSVCVSVEQNHEPCKIGSADRDEVWDVDSGDHTEPCIGGWGLIPPGSNLGVPSCDAIPNSNKRSKNFVTIL